jgi:hypothetical protein
MSTPPFLCDQIDTESSEAVPPSSPVESNPTAMSAVAAPQTRRLRFSWINQRLLSSTLLLLMGVFTGIGIRVATHPSPAGTKRTAPTSPAIYTIRRVSHAKGDYPSVAAALHDAPHQTAIVICEEIWEESLQFRGGDSPRAIRIEGRSPTGTTVCWRPPPGHPADQPLLRISGGAELTMERFTLDGQDRVNDLVSLTGSSAGLTLEDLDLHGFRQNGVVLHDCNGSEEQPITLQGLRIASTRPASSAVFLEAREGETNSYIRILDCCFEGPYQVAVRLHGPARELELSRNRE